MKKLNRFFWWCAGANLDILEKCPTEHSKYFGIGGTIFFTAMMASFAGGYAIYTAFQNQVLSIFFGIFWGCMIFNLDRYIVSSIGKGDGTTRISRDEWINSSPRILMALLLGFVIATPLELKVFEKEIEVEIQKIINEQRDILGDGQNDRLREIQRIKNRMAELKSDEDTLIRHYSGGDARISTRKADIRDLSSEQKELNNKLSNVRGDYEEARKNYNFAKVKSEDESLSSFQRSDFLGKKNRAEAKMVRLRSIIHNYENRINQLSTEKKKAETAISQVQGELEEEISVVKERNMNEFQKLTEQLRFLEDARNADLKSYGAVAQQYNGFMARLEALNRLCVRKKIVAIDSESTTQPLESDSLSANLNSLESAKRVSDVKEVEERTPVYWARILITLMFIFIEIAPVMFKMMTESGPYDDRMDEVKYDSEVSKKKKMSDTNERINTELVLSAGLNKNKLDAELASNAILLQTIAESQAEIAKVAIRKWKEQRMINAENDPNTIVKSVPSNGLNV